MEHMLSLCRPCAKSGSANLSFYSTVAPSSERSNWSRSLQSSLAFDMAQSPNTDSTSAGLSTAPSTAYSNLDSPINFNPSGPSREGRGDTPPPPPPPARPSCRGGRCARPSRVFARHTEGGGGGGGEGGPPPPPPSVGYTSYEGIDWSRLPGYCMRKHGRRWRTG